MSDDTTVLNTLDQRGVATVTLNRPDKHNAFDDQMIQQLRESFTAIADNPKVRVMVLAATGKNFSAGADLDWMKRMAAYSFHENQRDAQMLADMLRRLQRLPVPTIARVQGAVMGGAVGLVSCCDMAVATEQTSFCLSEVKIGLIPATISPYVMAVIGERAARRYFTTAERFSAIDARQLGLVTELVAAEQLDQQLEQLITAILSNAPKAVRAAKKLVLDFAGKAISDELIRDTSDRIASIRVSEEAQTGLAAFLNKQLPPWSGDNN